MFLPPSPLPKAVPAAGQFRLPLTPFSLRFSPYPLRAAQAPQKPLLQRRPSHSRLIYQGVLQRRRPPPRPPVRLYPFSPCLALQPLRRRRRADEQRQQRVMHPRCRLWIRARRASSVIFHTRYNPAANSTAATGPACRSDPCSCRLAGPHGATIVRPRPHRAYMRTPLLRLTPSSGDTPTAHTRSDALGDAADLRFADSVARYSHADWKREQHGKPMCHVMMRYVSIGRPSVLPPDVLACYSSHKRTSLSDIQELVGKGRLYTTDEDIILLVRNPTLPPTRSDEPNSVGRAACLLNDEAVRIYVPLLMRPWIMQACHSTASCHLGTTRTLRML